MIVLKGRSVNELWAKGMLALAQDGVEQDSRAGRVRVLPYPVLSVYERPYERVLMDAVRDANPMFHLMESLWMLAGRDDAAFLDRYVGDFGERYAEKDGRIHGAYGYRWRHTMGFDQLDQVVNRLRDNPNDRQAVIQMWDAAQYEDWRGGTQGRMHYGSDDLEESQWKDRPCNTHIYLRVRTTYENGGGVIYNAAGGQEDYIEPEVRRELDLTVCCRSNDIVFGAYGANAVHFSVLQEYLAGRLGVSVGRMYQFSNNYHGYVDVLRRQGDPLILSAVPDPYTNPVRSLPMGKNWEAWDSDLRSFMEWHDDVLWSSVEESGSHIYANSWFAHTAVPVSCANYCWKHGNRDEALKWAEKIDAPDWRAACVAWMQRRMDK